MLRRATLLLMILLTGCDQFSQPKNFDDCILKHMEGVTSDQAAKLIYRSCRAKFPADSIEKREIRDLTGPELSKLTGSAGLILQSYYGGSIYNGNKDITVTSVTIQISGTLGESTTSRDYTDEVTVPPLSTREFGVNIVGGDEGTYYSWSINSARGYGKSGS